MSPDIPEFKLQCDTLKSIVPTEAQHDKLKSGHMELKKDCLILKARLMKELFDSCVDSICKHAYESLKDLMLKYSLTKDGIYQMVITGGYTEPYIRFRMYHDLAQILDPHQIVIKERYDKTWTARGAVEFATKKHLHISQAREFAIGVLQPIRIRGGHVNQTNMVRIMGRKGAITEDDDREERDTSWQISQSDRAQGRLTIADHLVWTPCRDLSGVVIEKAYTDIYAPNTKENDMRFLGSTAHAIDISEIPEGVTKFEYRTSISWDGTVLTWTILWGARGHLSCEKAGCLLDCPPWQRVYKYKVLKHFINQTAVDKRPNDNLNVVEIEEHADSKSESGTLSNVTLSHALEHALDASVEDTARSAKRSKNEPKPEPEPVVFSNLVFRPYGR